MKELLLISLLFFLFLHSVYAQKDNDSIPSQNEYEYDNIIKIVEDKSISFIEKYKISHFHLTMEQQIEINDRLIKLAEKEGTKEQLVTLCCNTYSLFDQTYMPKEGWPYLEKAYKYSDQIKDNDILGFMYYMLGQYYGSISDDITSHEFYYKSIPYIEKSERLYPILNTIYFMLSVTYSNNDDNVSLKKIIDKMLALKLEGDHRGLLINTYSMAGSYFSKLRDLDSTNISYQDSTIFYYKKAVDVYELLKDSIPYLAKSEDKVKSGIYIDLATELMNEQEPDWDAIISIIEKGRMNLTSNSGAIAASYYRTKGEALFKMGKFKEAKDILLQEEKKLGEKEFGERDFYYAKVYGTLSKVFENLNDYKSALKYNELAYNYEKKINDFKKYESLKSVEAKYETAQKDLEISQLNEREQRLLYNRTLIITISIIVVILLLFALLYNRYKRQQKEKEAILKDKRIEEKEYEYQTLLKESENKQMRHYLDGLETERTRLAKELHDNVANELYVASIELTDLKSVPKSVTDRMKDLHTQIRSISHDLMPPRFQYASLSDILYNHLIVLEKQTDIAFSLSIDNTEFLENISATLSHEIYRIVQECTGNIIKHSSAQKATILLLEEENLIKLIIEDEGKGFDTTASYQGIGLYIISERCHSLNGTIDIKSEIGNGCKITILIPLTDSEML